MEKFIIYTGTTVPLMNDNIDTDQILPKQFLKLIDKKGFGKYLMYAWRYLDNQYTEDPDFVFNRPEYRKATILITGDNFGAGSSPDLLEIFTTTTSLTTACCLSSSHWKFGKPWRI